MTKQSEDQKTTSIASKKKEYLIPVSNLQELSDRINQYIYFCLYMKQNNLDLDSDLMIHVKEAKELFKDPHRIKSSDFKKVMSQLPEITGEQVVGMSLQ